MLLRRLARGTKKRSAFRPGGGLGRSDRASLDWLLESKAEENAMAETAAMNGAEWLARALAQTGMSHVFFVESVMRRTLLQLSDLGVKPVLAHSEKAAAYMADGYARVARRPGVCMAQSVGAANLASGLQDPWLGRSPVIALTGHKEPSFQHRNSYQEIPHAPLFSAVTKFSSPVYSTSELPRLLRHAWRAALSDTPRPAHLDFNGLQGDVIELGHTYPTTTGLLGDPKATLARLVQAVGRPGRDTSFADEAARIVADWRASMAPLVEKNTAPIAVERLCAEVTRALPADGILVADT